MNIKLNNTSIELTPNIKLAKLLNQNPKAKWWKYIVLFIEEWANSSKFIVLKTSGSTGNPKTLKVEKKKMWLSATKTCEHFELNNKSIGLLCLSASYIAGKMMLVRAMVSGMNLICVEPSDNPVKELTVPIDFAAMVPMQVQQSLSLQKKFNLIKHLIIGGARVSHKLTTELQMHKVIIHETFGMTETLSHIALREIAPNPKGHFKILSGVTIKQGKLNELIVNAPELGAVNLKTNDIVELLSHDSFKWKGRLDFVINTGGIKVLPEEVESQIAHLIPQKYCIVGTADKILGEKVELVIEGKPFNTQALANKIKTSLPSYFCPKKIRFINNFPLTESGKINRKEIAKLSDYEKNNI